MAQKYVKDKTAEAAVSRVERTAKIAIPLELIFKVSRGEAGYAVTVNCRHTGMVRDLLLTDKGFKNKESLYRPAGTIQLVTFFFTEEELSRLRFYNKERSAFLTVQTATKFDFPNLAGVAKEASRKKAKEIEDNLQRSLKEEYSNKEYGKVSSVELFNMALVKLDNKEYLTLIRERAFYEAFIKMVNKPLRW